MNDFVHLHVHTEYSLLDGQSRISELVQSAKEMNMPAVGITDHGVMFGVIDHYRAAIKAGVKPIIGAEFYLATRTMDDRDAAYDKRPFHMLLLAKNQTGYQNLLKLASEAQLRGYYYRPRIDREFMAKHSEGVIATSGCLASEIPRLIESGQDSVAREKIGWYQDVFGPENFYLELQPHKIDQLGVLNDWLVEYRQSGHSQVGLLATNDVHYVREDDADSHDTLVTIQTRSKKTDLNRMRINPMGSYYFRSGDQMREAFNSMGGVMPPDMLQESFENTLRVADMCNVDLSTEGYHLPVFPVPDGFTNKAYLRFLVELGMDWRYGDSWVNDRVLTERVTRELEVIDGMGFNTYFMIVWDLCEFARYSDIWWNVRGSGAGSVVAYSLGITNVDPIKNSLLFERFLNKGRNTMPDIDIDYPDDRRAEMIAYTVQKYGEDKVAAIITFGTMGAKAAVRDIGRALSVDLDKVNHVAALIPQEPKPKPIKTYVAEIPELTEVYNQDSDMREVIDTAERLQGITRHASTHAAGIIVSDRPLVEYLPLHRITGTDPSGGALKQVTQFPMETAESIGLLKVDFLGLSTLTTMRRACALIEKHHGIKYDLDTIPYDHDDERLGDKQRYMLDQAFKMIGQGDTTGVFQIESTGMQQMLRGMKPFHYDHIVAAVALYRPGPMDFIPLYNARMHGQEEIEYLHPKLEPILANTYGVCVSGNTKVYDAKTGKSYRIDEIENTHKNMLVQSYDDNMNAKMRRISHWYDNGVRETYKLTLSNGAVIEATEEHEFLSDYGWVKLKDLEVGTCLATPKSLIREADGLDDSVSMAQVNWFEVVSIEAVGPQKVYDITVEEDHNFVANGMIVHNCVYQEQIMQIGSDIFGYELHEADLMRRAVSKKKEKALNAHRKIFRERGPQNGVPVNVADEIFDFIDKFANYGFNRSHATDYAVLSVQTAFLKCHYPEEYMTALLSTNFGNSDKVGKFLEECRRLGIPVLAPSINDSQVDFDIQTLDNGIRAIRFGLGAVKNVGVAGLEYIVDERERGGPFQGLEDFAKRLDLKKAIGKRSLESLAQAGVLMEFGERDTIYHNTPQIISYSSEKRQNMAVGQLSLFDFGGMSMVGDRVDTLRLSPPEVRATRREELQWERELLSLYITGRPIDQYRNQLRQLNTDTIAELNSIDDDEYAGMSVVIAGEIMRYKEILTKNNNPMSFMDIEDWYDTGGVINVVLFPQTHEAFMKSAQKHNINPEAGGVVVVIRGNLDLSRGKPQVRAKSVMVNLDDTMFEDVWM